MQANELIEAVGHVVASLLARGEFGSDSPAWDLVRDEEVLMATDALLAQMGARVSITHERCYLVATDASSPLLRGTTKMADVFRDQARDEPGRANLIALVTLLVLRKMLDPRSEDGLSQAARGGVVPVSMMVDECEDALRELARQEGLSDFMTSAIAEWDRSAQPASGHPNVNSHEGYVRYVILALSQKGVVVASGGEEGSATYFGPTSRLAAQAREVLDSDRYQEIVQALGGEEE